MTLEIIPLDDPGTLLEINNAAVPDVGVLTTVKAQWLADHMVIPGLAVLDGRQAGVVVVLSDNSGYDSDYYRWFTARYQNFLYVDRIVVADWTRGRGVAQALYEAINRMAQERRLAIVADVYSEPPNTPSLNFTAKWGFKKSALNISPLSTRLPRNS